MGRDFAVPVSAVQRARLEHPYRRSVVPVWIGSGLLFGTTSLLFVNEISRVPAALLFVVVAVASWWAPTLVLGRRRRDPAKPRATWKQRARVVALLLLLYFRLPLTVAMCAAIGFELDATAWIAIAAGGLAFVVHWTLGVGFLLRALRIVRPASDRLRAAVALAAERCKTHAPAAFELDAPLATAFALPASRCVVDERTLNYSTSASSLRSARTGRPSDRGARRRGPPNRSTSSCSRSPSSGRSCSESVSRPRRGSSSPPMSSRSSSAASPWRARRAGAIARPKATGSSTSPR
jgi:hypothetical protein